MGLEVATFVSDLVASNPVGNDPKSQGDDHFRLLKSVLQTTFPNANKAFHFPTAEALSANDTAVLADQNNRYFLDATAAARNITLPTLTADDKGWYVDLIKVDSSGNAVLVTPASGSINGTASVSVTKQFARIRAIWSGTAWFAYTSGDYVPAAAIPAETITLAMLAAEVTRLLVPVGAALDYAGTTEPSGYLFAFGQAISRTTYATLFARIGISYGVGDGSTTFNLPDARGRVIAGKDDMGGVSANRLTGQTGGLNGDTLGATGGAETHVLTTAQLAAHRHFVAAQIDTFSSSPTLNSSQQVAKRNDNGGDAHYDFNGTSTEATVGRTSETGSDQAHNNVQPTLILNKIISTGVA